MSVINQQVAVEQSTYQAGLALARFIGDVKAALAKGSTLEEVTGVATALLGDLLPVVAAVPQLKADASEDAAAELNTIALTGVAIYKAIKG